MTVDPKSYKEKLHPAFFEFAELNQESETDWAKIERECQQKLHSAGASPSPEVHAEVDAFFKANVIALMTRLDVRLAEIRARHSPIPHNKLAYSYLNFSDHTQGVDDKQRIFEYIHWQRHGESLERTMQLVSEGDIKALRRLQRTEEDNLRVFAKQGPIKKFQGDTVHRQLLEMILCYETAPMTKEERADCADEYCACGKTHDPDALDKQYRRLKKQLKASESPSSREP